MEYFYLTLPWPWRSPSITFWLINYVLYGLLHSFSDLTMVRAFNHWQIHIPVYSYLILAVFVVFVDDGEPINYLLECIVLMALLYLTASPNHYSVMDEFVQVGLAIAPLNISINLLANAWMHLAHYLDPVMKTRLANYGSTFMMIIELGVALLLLKLLAKPFHRFFDYVNSYVWALLAFVFSFGFNVLDSMVLQKVIVLPTPVATCLFIGYFLAFVLFIWDVGWHFKMTQQVNNLKYEIDNLRPYTSEIEAMYDNLRRFRHDYKNILFSLQGAAESGNIHQVKEVLDQVVMPSEKELAIGHENSARLANLKELAPKSLIYNKLETALQAGLKFQLEVPQPLSFKDYIHQTDIVRILAILIDNAIAGAKASKDKVVNVSLFKQKKNLCIVIGNSTAAEQVELPNDNQLAVNFSDEHGIGRRNLRMILARYFQTTSRLQSNHHWFEQTIIFEPIAPNNQ